MPKLSKRSSRYSVGKVIGGAVYIHRQYQSVLPEIVAQCLQHFDSDFEYTVVKYAEKVGTVSFVQSPDFDVVHEPEVGDLITVTFAGEAKRRKRLTDPYIYHHKWLFVRDDYDGFDVEESKERSRLWLALSDVDKRRIGRKSYWETHVVPRIPSATDVWLSNKRDGCSIKGFGM